MSEKPDSDESPLTERATDDTDVGWGERPNEDDDDERLLREKPPHW